MRCALGPHFRGEAEIERTPMERSGQRIKSEQYSEAFRLEIADRQSWCAAAVVT